MEGFHLLKRDPDRYTVRQHEFGVYFRTPWIWSNDPDEAVDVERIGESGYGGAFFDPPCPITIQPRAAQDLFFAIDETLLRTPDADTKIWKFESDWDPLGGACWSPYFEWNWWGTCMWTVRTDQDEVVIIGASATE